MSLATADVFVTSYSYENSRSFSSGAAERSRLGNHHFFEFSAVRWLVPRKANLFPFMLIVALPTWDDAWIGDFTLLRGLF